MIVDDPAPHSAKTSSDAVMTKIGAHITMG